MYGGYKVSLNVKKEGELFLISSKNCFRISNQFGEDNFLGDVTARPQTIQTGVLSFNG